MNETPKQFQSKCRACLDLICDKKYVDLGDFLIVDNTSLEQKHEDENYTSGSSKKSKSNKISLLEVFNECTQLQVTLQQGNGDEKLLDSGQTMWSIELSRYLCNECCIELENAYKFIRKAKLSNEKLQRELRQYYQNFKAEPNLKTSEEVKHEISVDGKVEEEQNEIQVEFLTDELVYTLDEKFIPEKQKRTPSPSSEVEDALAAIFGSDIYEIETIKDNTPDHDESISIEYKNEYDEESENDDEEATSVVVHLVQSKGDEKEDQVTESQHTLQFKCELCTAIYDMQRELALHYEQDHDQRDFNFSCNFCEQRFFSKSSLTVHTRQIHQNCEYIDCSQCGRTVLKSFFKMHQRRHRQQRKFLCFECPSTFTSKYTLQKHLLTHAKDRNRNIECDVCGRKFYTIESFRTHQIIHQDPKDRETYSCSLCQKTFMRQTNLKLHMQMHRGETIDCPHCGKKFVRRKDLEVHIRFHTGDFPFSCSSCDRRFAIKSHLNAHERKHKGVKYQCNLCNKQFINVAGLRQHSYEHTGMPLCCGVCQRGFPTKFKVRRHLRSVHHNLFPMGYKEDEAKKYIKELQTSKVKSRGIFQKRAIEVSTKTDLVEGEESYEMVEMLDENEDEIVSYLDTEI